MRRTSQHNTLEDLYNSEMPVLPTQLATVFEKTMDKYDHMAINLSQYQIQLGLVVKVLKKNPKIDHTIPCLEFIMDEIAKYTPNLLKKIN